jgi:anti-sigma regulatory factor (Ser/Thr protein kinase)
MMQTSLHAPTDTFRHEALLYAGEDGFVAGTVPFIRDGVAAGEPILVVVDAAKLERLRAELNGDAEHVEFADMAAVGANPGRIIAAWREFVDRHAGSGRRLRGIGEPINPRRRGAELVECHRHEELLNLAFADADGFWLVCPYDTEALDPEVVERAQTTHPLLREGVVSRESGRYDREAPAAAASDPLPEPSTVPEEVPIASGALARARECVRRHAIAAGLSGQRRDDLVLAVTEAAANTIRHGGGNGELRVWREPDALVCEMRDGGRLDQPLAGRLPPPRAHGGGYGLWLVTQVCDLVQLRLFADGSVVRMHMRV